MGHVHRAIAAVSTCVGLMVLGSVAHAHHGFTGRYDSSRPIWLEGEIVRASFGQPHATITLRSTATVAPDLGADAPKYLTGPLKVREEDRKAVQIVETPPVATFFEMSKKVKPGDTVQVLALRNCRAPHQLRSQWIRTADGELIVRDTQMSYMVAVC